MSTPSDNLSSVDGDLPSTPAPPLGRRAARGALVTVGGQVIKIAVQVLGVAILARLLTPGDYGLVAMVATVVGVAEIFRDFGLSAAAIQATNLSRGQRDNLFWLNTAAGAVLTILVVAGAPLIAGLFGRPELTDLTRVIAVVFVINGMTTQYRADLNRHLRFSRLVAVEVTVPVVALGVAIGLASMGAGYWALAVQQVTTSVVLLIGYAASARWLPRWPDRSAPMRGLLGFGSALAGSSLINYLGNNIDSLVIGLRFGATPLGLYNRGYQLLMLPLAQLRTPTTTVALPVLARIRRDRQATDRYVQQGQLALGLTMVTGLAVVIGAARPITAIFLGDQWLAVEPILRLLAAAATFQTLAYVGYWIYLAHGLTGRLLVYTMFSVAIKITCIVVGGSFGLVGVACGYAAATAIEWPISLWWLSRVTTVSVRALYVGAARILGMCAVVGSATYGACRISESLSSWWQLAIGGAAGLAAYVLVATLIPVYRRDVSGLLRLARSAVRRH